jgi:hypothetical protein
MGVHPSDYIRVAHGARLASDLAAGFEQRERRDAANAELVRKDGLA